MLSAESNVSGWCCTAPVFHLSHSDTRCGEVKGCSSLLGKHLPRVLFVLLY